MNSVQSEILIKTSLFPALSGGNNECEQLQSVEHRGLVTGPGDRQLKLTCALNLWVPYQ
jgi:hypothetical protein